MVVFVTNLILAVNTMTFSHWKMGAESTPKISFILNTTQTMWIDHITYSIIKLE
jgi:hypothetical protein